MHGKFWHGCTVECLRSMYRLFESESHGHLGGLAPRQKGFSELKKTQIELAVNWIIEFERV